MDAVEFVVDGNDSEAVAADIFAAEAQYNIVKLPVNKPGLMALLQENGYRFTECMLNLTHDLNESKIKAAKSLSHADVSYAPMKAPDIAELFSELEKNLFNTDRIYNDPNFAAGTSALRYKNWLSDELEKGSAVYKLSLNDVAIGFFALKKMENDIFDPFLLGLYNAHKGKGLGRSMAFCALSECKARGAKLVSTHISSNNPANIKVYKSLGYNVESVEYVFVKHRRP